MNLLSFFTTTRRMTKQELEELRELQRIHVSESFKLTCVRENTALVPDGKEWVKQQEAIVQLIENAKNGRTSQVLAQCGYPAGVPFAMNLKTGKIVKQ